MCTTHKCVLSPSKDNSIWKVLILHMLSLKNILPYQIPDILIKMQKYVYKQLLECWSVLKDIRLLGDSEILNECFYSNSIKAGSISSTPKMFGSRNESDAIF